MIMRENRRRVFFINRVMKAVTTDLMKVIAALLSTSSRKDLTAVPCIPPY